MAKRFTDTNKYKKPFIRGLQGAYKLFWDYLYHDCDHAGIWIVDIQIAQMYLGSDMKITKEKALLNFNSDEIRIVEIDNGKKWFIPSFITFQYGQLSETNRAHSSIIIILKKLNLLNSDLTINLDKPLISPLQGDKEMDMEKEMDMVMEKEKGGQKINEIIYPFESENFKTAWSNWNLYRKEKKCSYKGVVSEQSALKGLSKFNEEFAIRLIEKSMSNGWQGLIFEKTEQEYEQFRKSKSGTGSASSREEIASIVAARRYAD